MHNFLALLPIFFGVCIPIGGILGVRQFNCARQRARLKEIDDAPFPFDVGRAGGNYYIRFDLGDDMKLWCNYDFGIREDGLYGINELKLEGFNSYYNTDIELEVGQSVFPLVEKMTKLTDFLDTQPFDYTWDSDLEKKWEAMKKKLNNLRYLETKSKEQEKKKQK